MPALVSRPRSFCGFATGDLVMFQQMGFGVAVSLLDATSATVPGGCPRQHQNSG